MSLNPFENVDGKVAANRSKFMVHYFLNNFCEHVEHKGQLVLSVDGWDRLKDFVAELRIHAVVAGHDPEVVYSPFEGTPPHERLRKDVYATD